MNRLTLRPTAFALALLLAGCGGDDARDGLSSTESAPAIEARDAAPTPPPDEPVGTPEQPASAAGPTVADVAAYEQGLRREIEVLRDARDRLQQAEGDEQRLEILGEIQPHELRRHGAAAAGASEARYNQITSAINDVLAKREMGAASRQMMPSPADLESMSPEQRAQVEDNLRQMQAAWGDPYEGLEPATAEAVEQRADELARLRAEHIGLLVKPL